MKHSDTVGVEDEDRGLGFTELLDKYYRKICNLILRQGIEPETAETLTQDVFYTAYRDFGSFRGDSKIQTWLFQISVDTCKDYFRQRDREERERLRRNRTS